MARRVVVILALAAASAVGCQRSRTQRDPVPPRPSPLAVALPVPSGPPGPTGASAAAVSVSAAGALAGGAKPTPEPDPRPLRRCFEDRPAWTDAPVADLLDRASDLYRKGDFEGVLACAEEASRQSPRSVEAHHDRALGLANLDRLDEARDAMTLALALGPDDPETLEAAADIYVNHLPPSAERAAIGLEYARRGGRKVPRTERDRAGRLALLEGQALVDLGRATEALPRIEASLRFNPQDLAARFERGVALFELCRFDEARKVFRQVLASAPAHAHAVYHLALIDERERREADATRGFAEATRLDPKSFPPPPDIGAPRFADRVKLAVAALPADVRADIGDVPIQAAEVPPIEDLTAEKPPLSPTILGLYRGLPMGLPETAGRMPGRAGKGRSGSTRGAGSPACAPVDRAIVLYRKNLLRTVKDEAALDRAIARTLMHEVGHLRGEDDGSLRDRGLE